MTTLPHSSVQPLIDHFQAQSPPRTGSLILSLFGDVALPHGGGLWLGELVELLAPFQLPDNVIRTAAYRLCQEGWLDNQRDGRRSRYVLTARGQRETQAAARRIYGSPEQQWTGQWDMVEMGQVPTAGLTRLRRSLELMGFGTLHPRLMIIPSPAPDGTAETLARAEGACLFRQARLGDGEAQVIARAWDLDSLAAAYGRFNGLIAPHHPPPRGLDGPSAFALRLLVIHFYRRVLLHDPGLPARLLPPDWPGLQARLMTAGIYHATLDQAESWAQKIARDSLSEGAASPALQQRFAA